MKPERLASIAANAAELSPLEGWWEAENRNLNLEAAWQNLRLRTTNVMDAWFDLLRQLAPIAGDVNVEEYGTPDVGIKVGDAEVWAERKVIANSKKQTERRTLNGQEVLDRRWVYIQVPAPAEFDKYATPGGHCTKQILVGVHDVEVLTGSDRGKKEADSIDVITGIYSDRDMDEDPFLFRRPAAVERWNPQKPVFDDLNDPLIEAFQIDYFMPIVQYPNPLELIEGISCAISDLETVLAAAV